MGAHTLGRMNTDNSGHNGPWLSGNDRQTFDNKYYSSMLDTNHIFTGRVSTYNYFWDYNIKPDISKLFGKHK